MGVAIGTALGCGIASCTGLALMTVEEAIVEIERVLERPLSTRSKRMLELRAQESAAHETECVDGWARALLPMGPGDFYEVRFRNGKPCKLDGHLLLRSGPR